jgi:D-serine deaminase-like pyridoxal phosphate-dependent protein
VSVKPCRRFALPAGLDTPVPVVDIEVLDANVGRMAAAMKARGVALRPHFKTPRMLEVARRQLDAGAVGITCATIGEAEALMASGVGDVFIAYPVWASEPKAARLARLLDLPGKLTVGIDSLVAARQLANGLAGCGRSPAVLVEVDSGDLRTGVRPERAGELARGVIELGLVVDGVFTHGGHGYEPDCSDEAADDEVRSLEAAAASLRNSGVQASVVSAGSTPTALRSARGAVTEERPGTYVFGDWQQVMLGSCRSDDVALVVASTVVSMSVAGQFVIDAGAKALSRDRPLWLNGHGCLPSYPQAVISRIFDHHAVCQVPPGSAMPAEGDVVAVVPNHVCPVVNLARNVVVTRNGEAIARWDVVARSI